MESKISKYYFFFKFILLSYALVNISFAGIIDVPSPQYPTIQVGIDSAVAGDTVLVQPGEYFENLIIEKGDIVVGSLFITTGDTLYKFLTVINGDTSGPVVTINTTQEELTFSGFTLKNGKANQGGGILCIMSSPTLSHLNIIENEADYGGGIYFKSDPGSGFSAIPKIENVRILNNLSNYDGGGVYSGLNAILENVRILGNQASRYGGGIFCSYLELLHVEIIGNIADRGGGIYFANHSASVDSSIINRNYASTGGGIFCDYFTGPTINNSENQRK